MAVQQLQRNNKKDNGHFYGAQKDTNQYGKSLIKTYIKNAINGHFYGAWSLAKSTAQCAINFFCKNNKQKCIYKYNIKIHKWTTTKNVRFFLQVCEILIYIFGLSPLMNGNKVSWWFCRHSWLHQNPLVTSLCSLHGEVNFLRMISRCCFLHSTNRRLIFKYA